MLALLWVVVLIPSWARNREYRVTEQHAARIQRTVRMLAETAELPEEHVVEATAKQVFYHQKALKEARGRDQVTRKLEQEKLRAQHRLAAYEHKKEVALHRAELRKAKLAHPGLKPVRVIAALAAFFGAIGVLVGAGMAVGGLGLLTLGLSAVAVVVGAATLFVFAPGKHAPQQSAPQVAQQPQQQPVFVDPQAATPEPDTSHEEHAAQQARAAAQRERARAMSRARMQPKPSAAQVNQTDSILLREEREHPTMQSHPQLDVQSKSRHLAAQERLRSMGVVGDTTDGATNLDEALRRRRNAS